MEYIPGGDFRSLLSTAGVLTETVAKFYTSEMIIAVDVLHGMGFIHRDIKPEVKAFDLVNPPPSADNGGAELFD